MPLNIPERERMTGGKATNAYGWITQIDLDAKTMGARARLEVNESLEHWEKLPIAVYSVNLGQEMTLDDGSAIKIATLDELMQNPDFAQAFQTIQSILEQEFQKIPELVNATVI